MTGPSTRRRGGVSGVTVGNVAIGVSATALLAAGPRLLGHEAFVGLALSWTITTVFGYGLAMPTEQLLSRRLNARDTHGVSRPMRLLVLLAVLVMVLVVVLGSRSNAARTDPYLAAAAVAGVVGWTVAAGVRGRIAGAGDLRTYAWLLIAEAVLRMLMVVIAAAHRASALPVLAAAVGLPILLAAAFGAIAVARHSDPPGPSASSVRSAGRVEQAAFILVAVGYQICLNAPPIVMEARIAPGSATSVGAFVIANSYYRLATVLGAGFATHALASLSHAWGENAPGEFRAVLRRALLGAAVVTSVATALAAAASPVVLPLFYGRDPRVGGLVLASLAVSTVLATVAAVATTALMAVGLGVRAAAWWLAGAAVVLVLIAFDGHLGALTAIGLTGGPALVLGGLLVECGRVVRAWKPPAAMAYERSDGQPA